MMIRIVRALLIVGFLASSSAWAASAGQAPAPERLARIDRVLDQAVADKQVAGVVALVLRDGAPIYEHVAGWADKEAGRRMTKDTIFRIASQTKALTSVAILELMEEGKLAPGTPVSRFIPAFEKTTVMTASGVVPATRPITIGDLLTHTAGISYGTDSQVASLYAAKGLGPEAGFGYYTADKNEPICTTMERLATLPFVAQPGEAFVYGYNTDILGCVVERASGLTLDAFFRERIIGPLKMTDTRFYVQPSDRARFAAVYTSAANGDLVRAPDGSRGQGHYVDGPRVSFSGGAGLTSTVHDYARFMEMIRRGGELDGVRILSPRSVALMTTNQTGQLHSKIGFGFGYGFQTVDHYGAAGLASAGTFGWGGAYGTEYRVDPQARLVVVLMLQLLPNNSDIAARFLNTVYAAVGTPFP